MATGATLEPGQKGAAASAPPKPTELAVSGMTCGNCARHVTEAIQTVPGVSSALVSLDSRSASVRWQAGAQPDLTALVQAVEKAGYGAHVLEASTADGAAHKLAGWQLNLWLGVLGTAPLMLGEWALGLSMVSWFRWFSFGLASVVQIFAGAQFYRGAWHQLTIASANMDTLVALGSTTAFGYSAWALLSGAGGHLYFMEAAAIITLVSLGHWLESRMSVRASGALRKLLRLAPELARRRNPDGTETETPAAALRPGDLVSLRPGDRIPTDGAVLQGESAVDESMLTGEATPIDKRAESLLYAGSVNLNGHLVLRVTATGEETALAHIIAAVQRAQTSRANIQRLGDRVSAVFVPVVVTVALAAGLWWGLAPASARQVHQALSGFLWPAQPPADFLAAGFIIAAAVLIVACPCAMGLATPVAIMAGSNAAAVRGILIRDGVALEKAGRVTAVLFDKTGTLTIGKPSVVKTWIANGPPPMGNPGVEHKTGSGQSPPGSPEAGALLGLAVGLARHSSHPISQAVAALSAPPAELADWLEVPGAGVQAKALPPAASDHELLRLGSLSWLQREAVDLRPAEAFANEWSAQGATIVGLAAGTSLRALFAIKDTLKSGAREVVGGLQRQGLKVFLVSGDNPRTAASIARQVDIPTAAVFAEVRPEQKALLVRKLQQQGERVAFVGDGINDAPALEQADLGVAVSQAADIAREAADMILLNSEIQAVPESLRLARATLRTIKQNLFWAFFYNAVGIPLAALGFMSPILCAAAMGLSDVVVIGNALRLRRTPHHTAKPETLSAALG